MVIREGDVEVIRRGTDLQPLLHHRGACTRSTRSNGRPATRSSRTSRRAATPSSSATSSSRSRGRRTRPTSSPRSTSAGTLGTPQRESSVRQLDRPRRRHDPRLGRARTATSPPTQDAQVFAEELTHLLVNQKAAFNSPVWFNVGRARHAAAVQRLLHPRGRRPHVARSSTGTSRRARSSRAARGRASTCRRSARPRSRWRGGGTASRPRQLHARRRRVGRHDQVRRQDAARRQDGDPQRRPPRRPRLHLVQGRRGAQGARPARRRVRHGPRRRATAYSIQYQNANNSVRVTDEFMQAFEQDQDWKLKAVTDRRDGRDGAGARADARDRAGGVGVRRPGHAVRHHDQRVAHVPGLGPHQRARTRARSTCTWTTPRATSRAST